MKNNTDIEKIFKEKFDDFSKNPPEQVWDNISDKVRFENYLKFRPAKINIYYVSILIIAVIFGVFYNLRNITTYTPQENISSNIINKTKPEIKDNSVLDKKITATSKINHRNKKTVNNFAKKESKIIENSQKKITEVNESISEDEFTYKKDSIKITPDIDASFTISETEGCAPLKVTFECAKQENATYSWNFGNGEKSNKRNPSVVYKTAGIYSAILTVKTGSFSKTQTQRITVNKKPQSNFDFRNSGNIFEKDKVTLLNNSENSEKYKWDFGDGYFSERNNPNHKFAKKGNYKVKLISYSKANCVDSIIKEIQIKDSKYIVLAPTGFTPNISGQNDGVWRENNTTNDIFYIRFNYDIAEFNISIFNRKGNIVYTGTDAKKGWNGYYKGELAAQDVYVWKCYGKFIDGTSFSKVGNVTLIYSRNQ